MQFYLSISLLFYIPKRLYNHWSWLRFSTSRTIGYICREFPTHRDSHIIVALYPENCLYCKVCFFTSKMWDGYPIINENRDATVPRSCTKTGMVEAATIQYALTAYRNCTVGARSDNQYIMTYIHVKNCRMKASPVPNTRLTENRGRGVKRPAQLDKRKATRTIEWMHPTSHPEARRLG